MQSGLEEYTYVNQKTKADVVEAKRQHDQLMDQLIITTIVCQAELFANAAAQLESIIDTMPEDRVTILIYKYISFNNVAVYISLPRIFMHYPFIMQLQFNWLMCM